MAALEAAGAIMNGLTTMGGWLGIGEGRQDKRQIKQQTKLNEVNAKTAKEMADYEQDLKLKMWKDTNYGANLAEAEKAGVSKAAAIGGGIGGGQAATVGSVGGGSAADAAATTNARTAQMQQGMQLASQLALQKAQKENIEADTANKIADSGYTSGAKTELTKEDTEKRKMDTLTQGEEFTKKVAESQYENRSLEDRIRMKRLEVAGQEIENDAKKVGIKVDKARIAQMAEQVAQGWEGLNQNQQRIKLEKFRTELEANYPGVTKVLGRITDDGLETLFNLRRGGGRQQMKSTE